MTPYEVDFPMISFYPYFNDGFALRFETHYVGYTWVPQRPRGKLNCGRKDLAKTRQRRFQRFLLEHHSTFRFVKENMVSM